MNRKKFFVLIVLGVFCIGMSMGAVSASHTFKYGQYTISLTDKQYDSLIVAKEKGVHKSYTFKTNHYKTMKHREFWKYKKIKKYHYTYKYKLQSVTKWGNSWSDSTYYYPKTPKGYKLVGSKYTSGNGWSKTYYKYRSIKKQPYYEYKPLYKILKHKFRLYVEIGTSEYGDYLSADYCANRYMREYKWMDIDLYDY